MIASYEDDDNMIIPSALLTEKIEGIVCLTLFSREYEKKICELGIPVVFMDSPVLRIPYRHEHDRIILEGAQSVYALTMDLIKRGLPWRTQGRKWTNILHLQKRIKRTIIPMK